MATCGFPGNTDMYGLGIRVGFYLQWFGMILANWVARNEVDGMRLSNSFFVSATFLALVVQAAKDNLRRVEIYIILLLTFGGYYYFIPLYIWRIITGCSPQWDPSRYPRVPTGRMFSVLNFMLLVSVSIFQLWFWIRRVQSVAIDGCSEYGFFFAKIRLNEKGFEAANILFNVFLLLCCLVVLAISAARASGAFEERKHREIRTVRKVALQEIQTLVNITIASTVVSATELTIHWNGITNVNDISSAGQLIPIIIGIGFVARVFYVWFSKGDSGSGKNGERRRGSFSPAPIIDFPAPNQAPPGPGPGDAFRGPHRPPRDDFQAVAIDNFPLAMPGPALWRYQRR